MPFDPTKPANGSPISAAELRNQFNALKALIDAITPPGPAGPTATGFGNAAYNGVYTATGTFDGKPSYTNPAGKVLFWGGFMQVWILHTTTGLFALTDQVAYWLNNPDLQSTGWSVGGLGTFPVGTFQLPGTLVTGTFPVDSGGTTSGRLTSLTIVNGLITGVTVAP